MDYRKSYLQYILNRIDFGDQPPLAFAFDDAQARVDYNLTSHHAISLTALHGSSSVDRAEFQSELGPNTVMTSGYRFSLVNLGSRYTPNARLLISNHFAWSHENGHVENRDNAPIEFGRVHGVDMAWRRDGNLEQKEHSGFWRAVSEFGTGRDVDAVHLRSGNHAVRRILRTEAGIRAAPTSRNRWASLPDAHDSLPA